MEGPPTVAIKEANVHLQALHERNQFLEQKLVELTAQLQVHANQKQLLENQQIEMKEKDIQISFLQQEIDRLMLQSRDNTKKDLVITQLTRKVKILNEILKYKSAIESISICLEQVEEDFILDIDNLVQLGDNNNSLIADKMIPLSIENDSLQSLKNADQETCL